MLFSPFMWPSPFSAMPRLLRHFVSVVLPLMNLHGRVDIFMGRFTRPSQAGRFDALQRPQRSSHKMVSRVPRGAFRRENRCFRRWFIPLRRRATYIALFKVAYFRISFVFSHNPRKIIRFHGVRILRSSVGRFQGWPPLPAACPGFHLGH
jgi:hypothetical protein